MDGFDVDLAVIGAGSGGVRAARIAAGHGARVAIAEADRIGGTCVIRGCVPKKLLVYASRYADAFAESVGFGWEEREKPRFDWARLRDNVQNEVGRLSGLYRKSLLGAGVRIIEQRAVLEGPNAVRFADGSRLTAGHILVATGGWPSLDPPIPGGDLGITSNEVFHLARLPRRLVVVGGGYIALEFASVFARLGSAVTLVHRGDDVLRGFDEDVRAHVRTALERAGITMKLPATIERMEELADGSRRLTLSSGEVLEADVVLVATGRRPNTAGLGLEQAGVRLSADGAVMVDAESRTTVPSIFAVGDVTNRVNLTPVAIREGHAFADTVFGGKPVGVSHENVPKAVFTTPEVGTVGLSEAEARTRVAKVTIHKAAFRPMKATISGSAGQTLMKLVVDGETDRLLGCHIVGDDAAEMIQLVGVVVRMGGRKADLDATMALHPTAAEELVTMRTPWVAPKA